MFRALIVPCLVVIMAGCVHKRPSNIDNLCEIFREKPSWYKAAKRSSERWGGPIHLPMAIMYQESSFRRKARPPMRYFLGFIPYGRASDAYGYSQALEGTWKEYEREAGSAFSSRSNFGNAFDFIQWYMDKSYKRNGVSKWDGYAQYLNYHDGHGGYARGTYLGNDWLIATARKVDQRAKKYSSQLASCKQELDSQGGWF
jgi:hypothetical protein